MSIIVKETGNTFTKAPEGVHQAVCCDVISAFQVDCKKKDGTDYKRDEVTIIFQLAALNPDNDNKRFQVRRLFGMNLATTGHLRPFLENWRGKKFTKEELSKGFDVEKLIGVNCNVNILHNGDWANIAGVMPLSAGQPKIEIDGYTRKAAEPQPVVMEATAISKAGELSDDDVPF